MSRVHPARCAVAIAMSFALTLAVGSLADVGPQAEPIVRAMEAHYRDARTLQAIFLERYSDGRSSVQVETGVAYFSRPGRMRWEYESPESKLFITDGKIAWFYVPADRTVTRAPMRESADWRTPLALLTGKAKLSQLCAQIDVADGPSPTAGHTILRCLPRGEKPPPKTSDEIESGIADPSVPFDQVLLEVDAATGELEDVRVREPGGVEIEYRFGNWKVNMPLEDSLFRFQAPAGVAIVEEPKASSGP